MTKFITTTAVALMLAAPAFAQSDTDANGLVLNDENQNRMNVDDLTMVGDTREFRLFEAPDGRIFRMPRNMFMDGGSDTDPNGLILNDDNLDRQNSTDLRD